MRLKEEEELLIHTEVMEMLHKGTVKVEPTQGQMLSSIFLVPKKDSVSNCYKSKEFEQTYSYGGTVSLKRSFAERGLYVQAGSERCLLFSTLASVLSKVVCFQWRGEIYQFLCLSFGLTPAPRIFTKLLKVPIAMLRSTSDSLFR